MTVKSTVRLKPLVRGGFAAAAVFLIAFCVYYSFLHWIPAGYAGVLYHAQGGLERKVYGPQRLFIGWMTQLYLYPTMERAAIYSSDPDLGEMKAADSIKVTTSENANTDYDVVVWYHIDPSNVLTIFDNYKGAPIDQIQSNFIRSEVRSAVSIVGRQYSQFVLMGPARTEANEKLTSELQTNLGPKGITVDSAAFASTIPNESIMQRITNTVNSETDLKIAVINRDIAEERKSIAITKAQADAEASRLKSQQTKAKSLELLGVEQDIEALKKWDGHLPSIQARPGQTVVITPETLRALASARSEGNQ